MELIFTTLTILLIKGLFKLLIYIIINILLLLGILVIASKKYQKASYDVFLAGVVVLRGLVFKISIHTHIGTTHTLSPKGITFYVHLLPALFPN
jgi:hypothetical protein